MHIERSMLQYAGVFTDKDRDSEQEYSTQKKKTDLFTHITPEYKQTVTKWLEKHL
jgi:hypothetical protein